MTGEAYVREADRALRETYEEPMSLAEYVDAAFETPSIASHASKYVLDAIEAAGTRTVVEEGEERTRYRFFDDPHNDGEHAVLGNTAVLAGFVDDLRAIAAGRGKEEKIIWFAGPTATGKSELKRCLINGLREYSATDEGRRYTVEWNVSGRDDTRGLSYGGEVDDGEQWYESPVQVHPFAVFPKGVRRQLLDDLEAATDDDVPIRLETRLDPFSREAYRTLEERYRREGTSNLFSAVTAERHLRVKNHPVDVGTGIGVLHPEDTGLPKERLVGSWMNEMLRALDSRGRKNPQAFSYDGVLSQGNGGLTIVEDASQHADLLAKLLNVPEERTVKLDKGIGMDVDTQLVVISNPDLEAQLDKHAERTNEDPLKALKRRLAKRSFGYLTNVSLEVELIRRELTDETAVWAVDDVGELEERVRAPLSAVVVDGDGTRHEREFAPHALAAAALYDVVTRLDAGDLPGDIELVEKAALFDRGYLLCGDERIEKDDLEFDPDSSDGDGGIPVTYTRDVLADLLSTPRDRTHPDLAVEDVITPGDVLDAMARGLSDAPVFAESECREFESRVDAVEANILERQEADVLSAMLADHRADQETVAEYVEHVYAWATDGTVTTDRGEAVAPDPLTMKVFEVERLGRFDGDDYDGTEPDEAVATFRRERILTAINRHAWEHRSPDFELRDVDLSTISGLEDVLATDDWDDVRRTFEDFDPRQWADPPTGTETADVKARTIDRMIEAGYSPAAAELTSRRVMEEASDGWD